MAKGKTKRAPKPRRKTASLKLTPKNNKFCLEYVKDFHATNAAIRAGYSPKAAQSSSSRLLSNVMVSNRIAELSQRLTGKLEITAERVLTEIARLAYFDIRKLYHDDGRLKEPHELDDDAARAICGIDVATESDGNGNVTMVRKIKTNNKNNALEMLAKHLGLIKDRFSFEGENPLERITLTVYDNGRDPPAAKT